MHTQWRTLRSRTSNKYGEIFRISTSANNPLLKQRNLTTTKSPNKDKNII